VNPVEAMLGLAKWMRCERVTGTVAESRAAICRTCPSLVHLRIKGTAYTAGFCGEPVAPTATTCGCLVLWGETTNPKRPAGKTTCSEEHCPQGKWSGTDERTEAEAAD
jgi:hypothetical protein